MADFDSMSRPELVKACTDRGLPSYGTKADLAARLRAAGEAAPVPAEGEADPFADDTGEVEAEPEQSDRESEVAGEEGTTPEVRQFTASYDVDELDDDEHAELCARILSDALAAGYRTRGGGRRVGGTGRSHTYGVSVR